MAKIGIAIGHGGPYSGAVGYVDGMYEKDLNLKVGLKVKELLEKAGHTIIINRTTDVEGFESSFAKKIDGEVDFAIAVHFNAFNRSANGFEVGIGTGANRAKSEQLATFIEKAVIKNVGIKSRGVKDYHFAMVNYSYPCAYCEGAFMDSPSDMKYLKEDKDLEKFALSYVEGIIEYCKANGLEVPQNAPQPPKTSGIIYRCVAGSYTNRENAEKHLAELKAKGIDCFLWAGEI